MWRGRERGGAGSGQASRITPIGRACDLVVPVRPGRDAALFAGVLGLMIEQGWIDREVIDAHTVGCVSRLTNCWVWNPGDRAAAAGAA